jgi:hypothetical protein
MRCTCGVDPLKCAESAVDELVRGAGFSAANRLFSATDATVVHGGHGEAYEY